MTRCGCSAMSETRRTSGGKALEDAAEIRTTTPARLRNYGRRDLRYDEERNVAAFLISRTVTSSRSGYVEAIEIRDLDGGHAVSRRIGVRDSTRLKSQLGKLIRTKNEERKTNRANARAGLILRPALFFRSRNKEELTRLGGKWSRQDPQSPTPNPTGSLFALRFCQRRNPCIISASFDEVSGPASAN